MIEFRPQKMGRIDEDLWLVGGAITILKQDGVRQWEG